MQNFPTLLRLLRERLSDRDLETARLLARPVAGERYDEVFERVAARLPRIAEHIERSRTAARERYGRFEDLPTGRQRTVLNNGSPTLLLEVMQQLLDRSFDERFSDTAKSLSLAECAFKAARRLRTSDGLSDERRADIEAEALGYLANARRICGDLRGAGLALDRAEALMREGSGDRMLKFRMLSFRASLLCQSGRTPEAARFFDRQIAVARLIGDDELLGQALIDRGWIASINEPFRNACRYISEGASLVDSPRKHLRALHAIAERLARDGDGLYAWQVLVTAELPLHGVDDVRLRTGHRWIRGLALRALDKHEEAARELRAVRRELLEQGPPSRAAFASIDLACVLIAQGNVAGARELASEAFRTFAEAGVDKHMLGALILLTGALRHETASEALAVRVANFLSRYPGNHDLRLRVRR